MISSGQLKQKAREAGFSACGLAPAAPLSAERAEELRRWLQEGCHGEMDYLARNVEKRLDPRLLVEGAKTVVSLAVNYYPGDFKEGGSVEENGKNAWRLARYAYGADYHDVVRRMLRRLMRELGLEEGRDGRPFVDTAPIDEKYWAQQAGLGWRGCHAQLIIPSAGSYFFLGELVLTAEADHYDTPMPDRCGRCRACVDACPMQALRGDGTMDARRCLSYLTIEQRGALPAEAAAKLSPCFYGCDRCAEVCPWNLRFARATGIEELRPRQPLLEMTPADWRALTEEQYRRLFKGSAVKRAKFEGLQRNIKALDAE